MKKSILIIINPSSGLDSKDFSVSLIFKKLRQHFETVSVINTNSPEHGFNIAKKALNDFDIIAAYGGDGTINSIAAALIGSETVLGILPGGSGNGLVRNLNIPLDWKKSLDVLINGKDCDIDVGLINNRCFFNVAGIGLDGLISKKFELEAKTRGIAPYVYYAFKGYFEMPCFNVTIQTDENEFQENIMLAAFANFKQYGGKAIIAPFADPTDRLLDLCLINKFKLMESTLNIQRLFTGNIHKFPFYKTQKFSSLTIKSSDGPIPCTIDGEYSQDFEEYKISVNDQRIKIRIPQETVFPEES